MAGLVRYFRRTGWPRLWMSQVVLLTGLAGFAASFTLLRLGETSMAIRYPISVGVAYAVFLLLLRYWAEVERRRFKPTPEDWDNIYNGKSPAGSKSAPWDNLSPDPGCLAVDAEGCAAIFLFGSVLVLLGAAVWAVVSAPTIIAEVFLDAALTGLFYHRLKNAEPRHWLGTAVRRTWIPVLLVAVLMSVGGAVLQARLPHVRSIGEWWRGPPALR